MAHETDMAHAQAVQAKYEGMLLAKPNVVGVAVGMATQGGRVTDEVAVVVMVSEKLPEAQLRADDIIPRELDGVRVDVQQTGTFSAG
ncbi:MAG: hypothetical protein D6737_05560 [Chloroflexi bacterium]|nr:MAG: hypothetical protein D6737_05560 [Chloroflexota bacterium]